MECGSGASKHASTTIIEELSRNLEIPLIVGGGITTIESAKSIASAGAEFIVISSLIEKGASVNKLKSIVNAVA